MLVSWVLWWRFWHLEPLKCHCRGPHNPVLWRLEFVVLHIIIFSWLFLPLHFLTFPTSWKFCDITSATSMYHLAILDMKLHKSIILNTTWPSSSKKHNTRWCLVIRNRCILTDYKIKINTNKYLKGIIVTTCIIKKWYI